MTYDTLTMAQSVDKLKAIIFDKDGTLFHYAEVWEPILTEAIGDVFARLGRHGSHAAQVAMLRMLGISEGKNLSNGLLFTHRKSKIASRYLRFCLRWGINPLSMIRSVHIGIAESDKLISSRLLALDFSVQQALFRSLKASGWIIGVVTNDYQSSAELFLQHMGLQEYIDFVATRESPYKKKPHPESFFAFCSQFDLDPSEVVMVGDTITDLRYAKRAKAGYSIAVESGGASRRQLQRHSDVVYANISDLSTDPRLKINI